MQVRTPIIVITGPLGSGKTTLLRHILDTVAKKIAILMNEFGEIAIDSQIIAGKNVQMADLGGGCVCCSLLGEFEAAVNEIIETVAPDLMVLETTGVAEPDALVFDIQDNLTNVRLDGVVTVIDADGMVQYPSLGHTTRLQIEGADTLILNKIDLVSEAEIEAIEAKLKGCNSLAEILRTKRCQIDPDLLFGIGRDRIQAPPEHVHQPEYESFGYKTAATFDEAAFEKFANSLEEFGVYRAKGFIQFQRGIYLFNFVAGRWDLEAFEQEATQLIFIGKHLKEKQEEIIQQLKSCEV